MYEQDWRRKKMLQWNDWHQIQERSYWSMDLGQENMDEQD
jgi:hypothetical protein